MSVKALEKKGESGPEEFTANDYNRWYTILSRPYSRAKGRAFLREFLSGVTVSLAQVPEAVAFAFTAGVDPIVGLQAAWIMCLLTGLFGGAPGMISGATGALAVVLPAFIDEFGVGYLFYAVIMMGIIQTILGLIGAGKLVRLIGTPVMIGFVDGLAIVIGLAQFHSFKGDCPSDNSTDSDLRLLSAGGGNSDSCWLDGATLGWQFFLVVVTMLTVWLLPRLTTALPSSLAGILLATAFEFALVRPTGFSTPLVEDLASVEGSFPIPIWLDNEYKNLLPSLADSETWKACLPIAVTLAVIGLVESLMTLQLVGDITQKEVFPRQECLAQGFANIVTGMFGGMGGCAMIGQSMINVKSGGWTRISSATAGTMLLLILLVAYPLINKIPIAALAGVMFMVVIGTFEWGTFRLLFDALMPAKWRNKTNRHSKVKRSDVFIIVLVTVIAVVLNLAYAVGAGIALSAIIFAWDRGNAFVSNHVYLNSELKPIQNEDASSVETEELVTENESPYVKIYQMSGPLFFGSAQAFENNFDYKNDPERVEIHFDKCDLCDYTALASINNVAQRYKELGKELKVRRVNAKSMKALRKAKNLMFVYDKTATDEDNETELLNMETVESKILESLHPNPNILTVV
mmetsp:Transcript_4320/g.5006  ORF Transcript_4320/g.5006 Transcript_4320/m.5006 type:complete len:631 (+) Transcript_4320:178-2070(+)|eukprot:CAMPEP_0184028546 /NCGR_PEP_ID=MMETSP0954-20121128/14908_1 /TAXON_ID=627963 /ORGANISM="Aplanochytrium sp, Strain PBS07" /LENGTH=630 /DNA_ID=CAMNT_0026313417 /DNA_START=192 /DNA_END=2084 /DNA_ORIENTATION=+